MMADTTEEGVVPQPTSSPNADSSVQHRVVSKMDSVGQFEVGERDDGGIGSVRLPGTSEDTADTATHAGRRKAKVTPPTTPMATPQPSFMEHNNGSKNMSEADGGIKSGKDGTANDGAHNVKQEDKARPTDAGHHVDDDDDDDDDILHDVIVDHHDQHADNPDQDLDRLMGLDGNTTYSNNGSSPTARSGRQTFDIESPGGYSEDDDDYEGGQKQVICYLSKYCCPCLPPCYKIGNTTVILPPLFERTGRYGVIGPHWPGLVVTIVLLYSASYYYTTRAFLDIGPISGYICLIMTTLCTIFLVGVAFSDPGMITVMGQQRAANGGADGGKYAGLPTDGRDLSDWRYCDLCSVYQPPDAAHCPDCQVCVDGYDHHCPWMGTCIGKRNMKAFVSFNLSWLSYLFYAVAWVTFGPLVTGSGGGDGHYRHDDGGNTTAAAAAAAGDNATENHTLFQ